MRTEATPTDISPARRSSRSADSRTLKQRLGAAVIPRLPITRHVFNHIRWELNATWVRLNNALNPAYIAKRSRIRAGTGLSVNVGCGPFGAPGWVNLDLADMPNLSLRYDTRRALPLTDGSADRIRCEHFFEHLDPSEEAPAFLRSCHRALRPGGMLRIVVPDAGRYLLAYASRDNAAWRELGWDLDNLPPDLGSPMGIINHVFRQGEEHRYAYDADTLIEFVRSAGFSDVRQTAFGESADPLLRDDRPNHRPYSLYVDATK
ncbi:MAG: methyltransferase domain-containing protein [Gemmatimonadaceae bacterium]|nr:methyltransferase domain-containing protein [Gemmatimonadaceae bacterium]NUQ94625.1 methyltransferase domain-containing protein [Gemmatimonadaceae bacterium]NUR33692.1 methyltransferase domain-containing protein [Gemmatimonadaceae bacterium]NUS97222.1 methyltransferase domain-containing protein [Gemmatimonadaceae bacterium]